MRTHHFSFQKPCQAKYILQHSTSLPELLAPAGSEESLHAAVENGADAVYFGLSGIGFNARARAKNFPLETLGDTIAFLHQRDVKGYITLNTLVLSEELPTIESLLEKIVQAKVDAVIVQDLGVARLVRQSCPNLAIHASTQMSLTSLHGIRLAQTLGIQRIVLPRELSIEQISLLHKMLDNGVAESDQSGDYSGVPPSSPARCNEGPVGSGRWPVVGVPALSPALCNDEIHPPIELECFVHGALCISFSGQCYASLTLGGRSANRGCCAQPCRIPYTLLDGKTDRPLKGFDAPKPILSPCDLAALPLIPDLIRAGIRALKIEGRLKPPEYVAETTAAYRKALDSFGENEQKSEEKKKENKEALDRMAVLFSRGFSTGWLEGVNPAKLVPGHVMAHRGTPLGTVIEPRRDAVVVKLTDMVRRGDGVMLENTEQPDYSQGGRVYEIIRRGQSVPEAEAGAKVLLTFANDSIDSEYVFEGQSLRKTDDPRLKRQIQKTLQQTSRSRRPGQRIPISIRVHASVGQPVQIHVRSTRGDDLCLSGDDPLQEARKHPASVESLHEQFDRLGETIYSLGDFDATIEGSPMVPLSVLGLLRKRMIEELDRATPTETAPIETDKTPVFVTGTLDRLREEDFRKKESAKEGRPIFHLHLRDMARLEDESFMRPFLDFGISSIYVEPIDLESARRAEKIVRKLKKAFYLVLPRTIKPGEEKILQSLAELEPVGILARNLEEIGFFTNFYSRAKIVADFSLNVVNDLSLQQILDWGADRITVGPDLGTDRLEELLKRVPTQRLERIISGRVPLFFMEHCLWRANLMGPNEKCRQMCRTHPLKLRDRRGAVHAVRSDLLCRNYIVNASETEPNGDISRWHHLRIEWDDRFGTTADFLEKISCRSRTDGNLVSID